MTSDIITIDNKGVGFELAIEETKKVCEYTRLDHKNSMHLQLIAEEMLSMIRMVTGEMQASFWLGREGATYQLHLGTKTVMDREKREELISAATSRKNEAAHSFIGKLRDLFEKALTAERSRSEELPEEVLDDLVNHVIQCADPEWDGYEQSTLKRLADTIKIGIRGGNVDMTVIKTFA